jgi:hypothetical protein
VINGLKRLGAATTLAVTIGAFASAAPADAREQHVQRVQCVPGWLAAWIYASTGVRVPACRQGIQSSMGQLEASTATDERPEDCFADVRNELSSGAPVAETESGTQQVLGAGVARAGTRVVQLHAIDDCRAKVLATTSG